MKNIFKITSIAVLLTFFVGCETVELEVIENPNALTAESADAGFLLNDIQLDFRNIAFGFSASNQPMMRMTNLFGTYPNLIDENAVSGEWATSYQMFSNVDFLENLNDAIEEEENKVPYFLGVAQVLEAYAYILLVDHVGNVPFTEANNPSEFPNPNVDSGASVYDAQLELLDTAIANLRENSLVEPTIDLYFGEFDAQNWINVANTLKLRAFLNLRLVQPDRARAGITEVLNSGAFINEVSEDFQFLYGTTSDADRDSRHPSYAANYGAAGAAGYQSNNLFDLMNVGDTDPPFVENGTVDPRARYYFYRQSTNAPSGSNLPCAGDNNYDYCYVGNLYWGRDHGDIAGIPNDPPQRTTLGVYPIGGAFDADNLTRAGLPVTPDLAGEGVFPIYTSANTHFALAEASLTLGVGGDASTLFRLGLERSMEKVTNFGGSAVVTTNATTGDDFAATTAEINDYVSRVVSEFNNASTAGKLNIIARENLLASFGNGIEPYCTYRRTGFPNNLQRSIFPPGPFPRSWRYPLNEVESNPNISQKPITEQVFWDNNPGGFIE